MGDIQVQVSDNDVAGITLNEPVDTSLTEGESVSYSISLNSQPVSPVTVMIITDGRTLATP